MKKKAIRLSITLLVLLAGGYFAFINVAPYAIIKPVQHQCGGHPSDLGLKSEQVVIQAADGVLLKGYWTQVDSARASIILIHGIGACKEQFLALSHTLAMQGIECIMVDNRGHGESGGKYTTYGYKEKEDIKLLVDLIEERYPDRRIGIWGNSLGGAISIQALEHDERIDFGIIESTFTDLDQIIYDYMKRMFAGFGNRTLSDMALEKAGEIADFDPDLVRPIESIKHVEQPLFIAHGDSDRAISHKYGEALYLAAATTVKELHLVADAGHNDLALQGGSTYRKAQTEFIKRQLSEAQPGSN